MKDLMWHQSECALKPSMFELYFLGRTKSWAFFLFNRGWWSKGVFMKTNLVEREVKSTWGSWLWLGFLMDRDAWTTGEYALGCIFLITVATVVDVQSQCNSLPRLCCPSTSRFQRSLARGFWWPCWSKIFWEYMTFQLLTVTFQKNIFSPNCLCSFCLWGLQFINGYFVSNWNVSIFKY